jgi:two-component system sensor histidine kinase DegS
LALAEYKNALAAEMHDGLQQYLGAIAMRLELARTLIPTDPTEAARVAVEQRHLARQAADELRVMVRRLRSPLVEKEGLAEALRQYLALLGERTSFATELLITGEEIRLPPRTEQVLLRIVQEALNNVMKHAQATRVVVTLEFAPPEVRCTVQDNGRGFDPAQLPTEPGLAGGFGMETMHGRAAELKGTCQVNSEPGEGVTVVVTVPYSPEQRRE